MATLPLPTDSKGIPYVANQDNNGNLAVPTEEYINSNGVYVPVSQSNPKPTQLTGSKAEQQKTIILANNISIVDTATHYYDGSNWTAGAVSIPNWNDYDGHTLWVDNSHDQSVTVSFLIAMRASNSYDTANHGTTPTKQEVSIPANGTYQPILLTDSDLPVLGGITPYDMSMKFAFSTAPTTGSLTIALSMWAK